MKNAILTALLFVSVTTAGTGCKKKKDGEEAKPSPTAVDTKPATPPPAPAPGSAAPAPAPAPAPVAMTGGSPLVVKDLGKIEEDPNDQTKHHAFEVTNNGKSVATNLQFYVFYYDKDKQGLRGGQGYPQSQNYSESLGIKPGETKVILLGYPTTEEPEGTAFVEPALTRVEFLDKSTWEDEKAGYPDRPMGGVR